MKMYTLKCLISNLLSYRQKCTLERLDTQPERYLLIQIFRYIYVCQWLWLGSQKPSAEFNCSLPPGPGPVSTAQILCQQSLFVECGLAIRRYVAAGAPPNITTLGFTPSNRTTYYCGFGLITYLRGGDIYSRSHRFFQLDEQMMADRIMMQRKKKGWREAKVKIGEH